MGKNNLFSFNITSKEVKVNNINIPEGYVNIPGFDGYMVNKHGSVIRIYCNGTKWKEVKGFVNVHGYVKVGLRKDNKTYHTSVHRIVAELFIPNPNGYDVINHIDEDKTNNDYTNLEWCTIQYNNTYKSANNKYIDKRKTIIVKDVINNTEIKYESIWNCSKSMNINSGTIKEKLVTGTLYKKRYLFIYG